MEKIKVSCDLTEKEYRNYMTFHVLGKKKDLIIHLVGCLLVLGFALANFHTNSPILGWIFLIMSIYLFFSRYLRFYMSVNRITEQYGLSDTPKHFYSITFKANAFDVANLKETAHYEWKDVYHVYFMEKNDMIYLYMNKNTAFLIPFRDYDIEKLKKLMEEKLPQEKITIKSLV